MRVEGLSKRFGATTVLDQVDLSVPAGSVCALLGPSGSGKTTLLRTIAGLERPDAGTVHLGERLLCGPGTFVAPERSPIDLTMLEENLVPSPGVIKVEARHAGFEDEG